MSLKERAKTQEAMCNKKKGEKRQEAEDTGKEAVIVGRGSCSWERGVGIHRANFHVSRILETSK